MCICVLSILQTYIITVVFMRGTASDMRIIQYSKCNELYTIKLLMIIFLTF